MKNEWLYLNVIPNPEFIYANWDESAKWYTADGWKIIEERETLINNVLQRFIAEDPNLKLDLHVKWNVAGDFMEIESIDCNNVVMNVQISEMIRKLYKGATLN